MAYSITQIEKGSKEMIKDFGYSDEKEFISEAVREKLAELKKLQFFLISEKIRKGLKKRGLKPEDILRKIKS
jgi:hypothetical protein